MQVALKMSSFVTMPSHVLPSSFVPPSLKISSSPCSWRTRPSPCCHLSRLPPSSSSKPLLGSHDYSLLKSLTPSQHAVSSEADSGTRWMEEVKERTREAFYRAWDSRAAMEMIDTVERLGISYHFEDEINVLLQRFCDWNGSEDLFTTALRFRLLRQNGFPTHSDIFGKFLDKNGKFKESLTEDIKGMLSLYEAAHLGAKGEDLLAEAKEFTRIHLIQSMPLMEPHFSRHVDRALELPRHLRMARLEARNYIDEYSRESNPNLALLELAKLEFDRVQSLHQKELAEIVRWWKQLGLVDKLNFARDRPMECFLWTVGIFPDPRHSSCRIQLTKTIAVLLVIDDIYDSYGSLDELVLFTDAVKRWDLGAMDQLPQYMKICYMALYNTTNDIAYMILKEHGWSIVEDLKRTWMDIFEAFLAETRWFKGGYVPSLEEYLANAVTTGGTYMALVHAFFLMGQGVTTENMAMLEPYPNIFSCSGKILRLWDDLGTAREEQERGDNASSIECYKREKDTMLEDEACRKHIRQLIRSLWVELNGEMVASSALPLSIIKAAFNLSRTAQVIYQHGDDNKTSSVEDHVQALLCRPVSSNGWDLGAMDQLPQYVKICYMALYNSTNDIAYMILKEHGWSIVEDLKRKGGVTMAMLEPYPNVFSCSGKILRLWDDLGTAREEQERGDNASSIECYKREKDTMLEDETCRKHIRQLIRSLWIELNGEMVASSALPLSIIKADFNLSRTAQVIYQHGDDNKTSSVEDHVQALFCRPVSSNGYAQITLH